ncbi:MULTISPECIES: hypothetical protein [unclassified Rhodococcus (in: high G+C Gram-positive bacteria)]|uniref:hypothetical protein n=1 Tax=unclassified Rhodococcus (in: high G+C Gram-positive bacteria) TaxID=192944 RepID=UPI001C9D859A|nr:MULTISPECIES: hypothetical protein [unclassified Rhodococcus (in: high G+C Gram-positive bacteria)]
MTPHVESILEGPRGRRLCLELARELEPDIASAIFRLAHGVEKTSEGILVPAPWVDDAEPFPASMLEYLSADLASLDLSGLDTTQTVTALGRSVNSAMYWQEPDGADVLAGHPIIRSALAYIAERIATSPIMEWFTESRRTEQWAIDWRSANAWPPLPKHPRQTLRQWAIEERAEEERAARERPRDPNASWGGTWWSIPLGLVETIGRLPAGLGLEEDGYGWKQATSIPVRGAGRTFEVRSAEDWILLCREFPLEVTAPADMCGSRPPAATAGGSSPIGSVSRMSGTPCTSRFWVISAARRGYFMSTPRPPQSWADGTPTPPSGSRMSHANGMARDRIGTSTEAATLGF